MAAVIFLNSGQKNHPPQDPSKQDFKMALRKYCKALRYMDVYWEKEDIDQVRSESLRKMKSHMLTNNSACKLKLGDLKGALLDADFAIHDVEDNVKAFYCQGKMGSWAKVI